MWARVSSPLRLFFEGSGAGAAGWRVSFSIGRLLGEDRARFERVQVDVTASRGGRQGFLNAFKEEDFRPLLRHRRAPSPPGRPTAGPAPPRTPTAAGSGALRRAAPGR